MISTIEYWLFRALEAILSRLPFRAGRLIGSFLGIAVFSIFRFRRKITLENLRKAFPKLDRHDILSIARGAYKNYGTAIMEFFWTGRARREELIAVLRLKNPEIAFHALARGKGLIILSAHFGSWELLLSSLRLQFPQRFVAIAQHQANGRVDTFIEGRRRRFDNLIVSMGPSVREILRALREREIVTLLGDQSGSRESIYIPFFGRYAATHRGPAAFSLKTGAPVVMVFIVRQPDGRYEGVFEEVDSAGLEHMGEEGIVELTRRHTAILEKYIRLYPDHWLWMHKRWKHTDYYERHLRRTLEEPAGTAAP